MKLMTLRRPLVQRSMSASDDRKKSHERGSSWPMKGF